MGRSIKKPRAYSIFNQSIKGKIMSLLQEVAAHGLAYCEYNQALISIQNLDQAQKIQIVKALIEDIYKTAVNDNERFL
jgi:hypothetical protein